MYYGDGKVEFDEFILNEYPEDDSIYEEIGTLDEETENFDINDLEHNLSGKPAATSSTQANLSPTSGETSTTNSAVPNPLLNSHQLQSEQQANGPFQSGATGTPRNEEDHDVIFICQDPKENGNQDEKLQQTMQERLNVQVDSLVFGESVRDYTTADLQV